MVVIFPFGTVRPVGAFVMVLMSPQLRLHHTDCVAEQY
jgi:hypothetical protein